MIVFNKTEVALRIWKLREEKGFTREAFAERAKLSANFIYDVETARRGISAESIFLIAQALDVSVDYLASGKNENERLNAIIELLREFNPEELGIVESTIYNMYKMKGGGVNFHYPNAL